VRIWYRIISVVDVVICHVTQYDNTGPVFANYSLIWQLAPVQSRPQLRVTGKRLELELARLDQLDQFRERGVGTGEETGNWMWAFSEILVAPPVVEILRVAQAPQAS
jgi:hypothetical protein